MTVARVIQQLADEGHVVGLAFRCFSFETTRIPGQENAGSRAAGIDHDEARFIRFRVEARIPDHH